ncbi:MAG: hypothetical protein KDD70_06585 [Bdellovibrionales bacterium]|nr:hypothetical protein [Bdellovibrionales bacterium]
MLTPESRGEGRQLPNRLSNSSVLERVVDLESASLPTLLEAGLDERMRPVSKRELGMHPSQLAAILSGPSGRPIVLYEKIVNQEIRQIVLLGEQHCGNSKEQYQRSLNIIKQFDNIHVEGLSPGSFLSALGSLVLYQIRSTVDFLTNRKGSPVVFALNRFRGDSEKRILPIENTRELNPVEQAAREWVFQPPAYFLIGMATPGLFFDFSLSGTLGAAVTCGVAAFCVASILISRRVSKLIALGDMETRQYVKAGIECLCYWRDKHFAKQLDRSARESSLADSPQLFIVGMAHEPGVTKNLEDLGWTVSLRRTPP